MGTDELIEAVCKKCRYWQNGCLYDYGDSLTKIPCWALVKLYEMRLNKRRLLCEMIREKFNCWCMNSETRETEGYCELVEKFLKV